MPEKSADFQPRADPYEEYIRATIEDLFLKHRGIVDVTAAEPGSYAYAGRGGGFFTMGVLTTLKLRRSLLDEDRDGFVTWGEAWPQIRQSTSSFYRINPAPEQHDQVPHAFQFPAVQPHDYAPPVPNRKNGHGLITIRNHTNRTIRYFITYKGVRAAFEYEIKPGLHFIHSVRMIEGRVNPPIIKFHPTEGSSEEVSMALPYLIIESTLIRVEPDLGTQFQFLSDRTGRRIQLFAY